ncbi:MAG: hypothetical protein R3E68_04410 [Burkholderiaceae bacterium]
MPRTMLQLMGAGHVLVTGRAVRVRSVKTLGLLAYLVLEPRAHLRARLAALLWPDDDEAAARHSLRQAVFWLRSANGAALADSLVVDGDLLRFVPDDSVEVDILHWRRGSAPAGLPGQPAALPIHPAPLLEGRRFAGCDEFEAWLQGQRQALAEAVACRALLPEPGTAPGAASSVDGLMMAARAAARTQAYGSALLLAERALAVAAAVSPTDPRQGFDLLLFKEAMLDRMGHRQDQAQVIRRLKALAPSLGEPALVAQACLREANLNAYAGSDAAALAAGLEALRLFREAGDLPGEAEARRELSFLHWRVGDHAQAIVEARAALGLHRQLGDLQGEATALHNLGEIMIGLGSPGQAMPLFEQAMALHWSLGHRIGEVLTYFGMARALRRAGSTQAAGHRYAAALALAEQHGERTMQARALHAMACLAIEARSLDEALVLLGRAIALDRSINYAHALGHDLADLAILHTMRREALQARAALTESLVWFESVGDDHAIAAARARMADLDADHWAVFRFDDRAAPIKSHLQLAEGKVYCAFESSIAGG